MPAFILRCKIVVPVAVMLAYFLADPVCARSGPARGNLHVLSIGINQAKGQKPLHACARTAQEFADFWATQRGTLNNQVNVVPPLLNEKATGQAILDALDRLIERAQPGDKAVLYVTTHGGFLGTGPYADSFAIAAYDRDVHAGELRKRLEALAAQGVRILLILDVCHAGAFRVQHENVIVLAACTGEQSTFQYRMNGQWISLYGQCLLAGLKGAADENQDGVITLAELSHYVSEQVEKVCAALKREHPEWSHEPVDPCCGASNVPLNLKLATVNAPAGSPGNGNGTGPTSSPN